MNLNVDDVTSAQPSVVVDSLLTLWNVLHVNLLVIIWHRVNIFKYLSPHKLIGMLLLQPFQIVLSFFFFF